jgi:tryptophan synthase alpha chain
MTHVVAGYPDLKQNRELLMAMAQAGADLMEIQIPFSDPMADGPVIMAANQTAIDAGVKVKDAFALMAELSPRIGVPLYFMTYLNVPFTMGFDRFADAATSAGAKGIILPDQPFDEQGSAYDRACARSGLEPIYVVSPDTAPDRLEEIAKRARGFIYATLKVGITGSKSTGGDKGLRFLEKLRTVTDLPIAAGFGLSSPEQLKPLVGLCDIAVVGSQLIREYQAGGVGQVGAFVASLKKACQG